MADGTTPREELQPAPAGGPPGGLALGQGASARDEPAASRVARLEAENARLREVERRLLALEEARRESDQAFRDMAENVPGVIYQWRERADGTFGFTWVSPRLEEVFGVRADEAHRLPDLLHPDDKARWRRSIELANQRGRDWSFEGRFILDDGRLCWWRGASRKVRVSDDEILYNGMLSDVTELKELEQQLNQAQRLEAIGLLAGTVAHDFNNLLTGISASAELARRQLEQGRTAELAQDLETILEATERAGQLTRRLLTFSREHLIEPRDLDLNEVLRGLHRFLARLLDASIELVQDYAPGPLPVHADPAELEQVVLNLAINARDAMPRGGRLTLRTRAVSAEAPDDGSGRAAAPERVELQVVDTGVGMTDRVRALAFDPFFTTKEVGRGTGLGLPTVRRILRTCGGEVELESAPGQGTTVRVRFLRVAGPAGGSSSRPPFGSGGAAAQPAGPGESTTTVLLVDDSREVRQSVERLLEVSGYRVIAAGDGDEALEAAARGARFDILVTDLVMPRRGGLEVAETLCAARPGLPVVFISGYAGGTTPEALAATGGVLLEKPFTSAALLAAVRRALERGRAPAG